MATYSSTFLTFYDPFNLLLSLPISPSVISFRQNSTHAGGAVLGIGPGWTISSTTGPNGDQTACEMSVSSPDLFAGVGPESPYAPTRFSISNNTQAGTGSLGAQRICYAIQDTRLGGPNQAVQFAIGASYVDPIGNEFIGGICVAGPGTNIAGPGDRNRKLDAITGGNW